MKSADIKRLAKKIRIKSSVVNHVRILTDAEAVLLKSTKNGSKVSRPDLSIWRTIMKSRITKLAAAAVVIIVLIVGIYQLGDRIEVISIAFSDVLERIRIARTVSYKITVEKEGEEPVTMHHMLLEPSRVRVEASDGAITIVDTYQGKSIILRPAEKKAYVMSSSIAPKYILNAYQEIKEDLLKKFPDGSEENIGQAEINGRKVVGFLVKYDSTEVIVWADADSGVPVQIESVGAFHSEASQDEQGSTTKVTLSNLVLGEELDDSLFSLTPPDGYSIEQISTPSSPAQEQMMRVLSARLMFRLAKACLGYAQAHDGQWPDTLRTAIQYSIKDETLLNLTDPELELGCIYIKPPRTDPRLVLLYQAHDKWPEGGINVSFVDCHTTVIRNEATFKEHLEFTLSQRE